jgi:predicted transcriptional regulator
MDKVAMESLKNRPRRSKMGILATILECIHTDRALTQNQIVMKTGLNAHTAKASLDRLSSAGLVRRMQARSRHYYVVTPDGIRWLRSYRNLAKRVRLEAAQ